MNELNGNLMVALSEIPLPSNTPDSIHYTIAVAIAFLAGHPEYAARFGQVLTEHTAPPPTEVEIPRRSPAERLGLSGPSGTVVAIIPIQRDDGLTTEAHIQLSVPQINALAECAGIWTCPDDISHATLNALITRGLITGGSVVTDLGLQWLSRAGLGDG